MNGSAIEVTAKETIEIPALASEKFRSRNSRNGTSGSLRMRLCHQQNSVIMTTPAAIRAGTETMPTIGPQSYACPSWSPKTIRNIATALSATPTTSKLWECVGSRGTSRQARTNAITPTGTLTRKIDSHPARSTRTPPRIGPTSVASPATAPHNAIALPRRTAGNVRVITAMVCGVIIEAPSPWTTRAQISPSTVSVSPHHSDARVKTVRPTR